MACARRCSSCQLPSSLSLFCSRPRRRASMPRATSMSTRYRAAHPRSAMRKIQRELHQELRREHTAGRDRITTLVRPIDPARLNEHPEPNGWSVGQVLEHLLRADEKYEEPFRRLMNESPRDAAAAAREWKSSFIGGMIASSLINPKPIKRGPRTF